MGHGGRGFVAGLAIAAVIMCIILFATRPAPNYTVHNVMNMSTVFYNITLGGYCGNYTITIAVTTFGRQAILQIPYFYCDATVNPSASPAGLNFILPSGLAAGLSFDFTGTSHRAYPGAETVWYSALGGISSVSLGNGSRFNAAIVSTYNDTITYIDDDFVSMGTIVDTGIAVEPSAVYGPYYGVSIIYTLASANPVPITLSNDAHSTVPSVLSAVATLAVASATMLHNTP